MRNIFTLQTFHSMRLLVITISTLGLFLLTGCTHTKPSGAVAATDRYTFSTADLNITLFLRSDGTYFAFMNNWAKVIQETGRWSREAGDFILHPQTEELPILIRRLRPMQQDTAELLMPLEPNGATNALLAALVLERAK